MTRVEKLMLRVQMIDQASGPANKLAASLDKITQRAEEGFTSIVKGGVGIVATGFALNRLTRDAREMNRALGEVASLDVAGDVLAGLEKKALSFSVKYGESATEFVRSSYDIQSAIAGLVGNELATFTNASNILAKGTKSDAGTITNYMGTMYGIFKKSASEMGKSAWVEQLTGQTAAAVQMFKTTGGEMSSAFSSLGAEGQTAGIQLSEQMAILGSLQATMSGSEAGTKYKSFLKGVGRAQDELGLKFEDSQGKMLPMNDILAKLQGKFGAIDTVAESDLLKKAFGSDEAVAAVKLLMNDADGLSASIEKLGAVKGMDKAADMAASMVDPLDRVNAASVALRTSFGKFLNNTLDPFYNSVADGMGTLTEWTQMFPHLTGVLAKVTLGVFGFVAAISALMIVKGLYILTSLAVVTAWKMMGALIMTLTKITKLWTFAVQAARVGWFLLQLSVYAGSIAFKALRAALITTSVATWGFTAALLANPITWIVIGIGLLVGALVALVMHWDKVTAAWSRFRSMVEDNPIAKFLFTPLMATVDAVGLVLGGLKKLGSLVGLDKLFGGGGPELSADAGATIGAGSSAGAGPSVRANHVPPGGLMEQINNSSNRSTHIEKLEVNTNQSVNGYSIADELQMAAG